MLEDDIRKALQTIDWSFTGSLSHYGLHRLHWYPATYIPQIPAFLIELFSEQAETVFDPFCGAGTTLVEALRLGRRAVGIDVNAVAAMISRAKVTFIDPSDLKSRSISFEKRLRASCEQFCLGVAGPLFSASMTQPEPPNETEYIYLKPWYHAETWREMLVLRDVISEEPGEFRSLLEVIFSHQAKPCSGQHRHWGYVADNMVPDDPRYEDAIGAFRRGLAAAIEAFEQFWSSPAIHEVRASELKSRCRVVRGNLLNGPIVADESVDLIVTSPPYPCVTDYTRSQRLSMGWFGESVDDQREFEIGARFKRHRRNAVADYLQEIAACINVCARALRQGRYMCMVVGESTKQRKQHGVVSRLREIVAAHGFVEPFGMIQRTRTRERVRSRSGTSSEEYILVFKKQ